MTPDRIAHYQRELRVLIGCPVRWEDHFEDRRLCKELRIFWVRTCEKHQADWESRFYYIQDIEEVMNDDRLNAIRHNASVWRKRAIADYMQQAGFLTKITHLDQYAYPKHFPNSRWTEDRIIAESIRSDSLFFPEVSENTLRWLFECILSQAWLKIIEQRPSHVFLTSEMVLGASEGEPTNTLRYDIDYSTPSLHSHPRLLKDVPSESYHFFDEDYDSGCYNDEGINANYFSPDIDDFVPIVSK